MVRILATGSAIAGIFLGLLFSPLPTRIGFYRWIASIKPNYIGLSPAFHHGVEWGWSFEELHRANLTGQTALVTGANSGLGFETSLALARLGASVTLACRNPKKCDHAARKIEADGAFRGKVETMKLDTSSLNSVREFSQSFVRGREGLDMLYLNAGIASATRVADDGSALLSEDGIELVFATNVLGHHLLYKYLEPLVMNSKLSRVVLTSSAASFDVFKDFKVATDLKTLNSADPKKMQIQVYGQSKLAQVLWAKELTRRLGPDSHVYVNAAHPGVVNSLIWDKMLPLPWPVLKIIDYLRENVLWNTTEGSFTMLYLGVAIDHLTEKNLRGRYFHPQVQEVVNPLALDEGLQKKLWVFLDKLAKDHVPN